MKLKLIKGKKAGAIEMISIIGALIVFVLLLYYAFANFPVVKFVGETQLSILNTIEFSERTFQYIDISSHISAKETIKTVLSNSGFYNQDYVSLKEQHPCGKVVYPVLNGDANIENCLPDLSESMNSGFKNWFDFLISKYSYFNLRQGDFAYLVAIRGNDLVINVDGISPIELPFYVDGEAYYNDKNAFFGPQGEGECYDAVEYSFGYLGSGYGGTGLCPAELAGRPGEANKCTTQCGSFVTNVYRFSKTKEIGDSLGGNGIDKCEAPGIGMKFLDPEMLQPGDIFSSTSTSSPFGHTGIFVGIGRVEGVVSNLGGSPSCFKEYIYDPNGEPVFIHSMSPVCFSTLDHLTSIQKRKIVSFCRPSVCSGS